MSIYTTSILGYRPLMQDLQCPMCKNRNGITIEVCMDGYFAQCPKCNCKSRIFEKFEDARKIWKN